MGDMQRHLALALSISALLIGGATWYRIAYAQNPAQNLTIIDRPVSGEAADTTIVDAPISNTDEGGQKEKLTSTDLVGRQLISQYLDLAQNGQATDANIQALAENAAQNIATINSFKPLTNTEIKIVADTKENFRAYGDAFNAINAKYQGLANIAASNGGDMSDISSKGFISVMSELAKLTKSSAEDLALLPVPASLASAHLGLINNYISSSNALAALSNANADSVTAFAGLVAQASNADEATSLILTIQSSILAQTSTFTP